MLPVVNYTKVNSNAVVPTRGTPLSVGMDLTIILETKKSGNTTWYDTGLQIQPQDGYYTEIVPRSSLSKSGYMLANSVGIIDPDYRGNLLIALTKVDNSMPDITLPFKCCQLILRKCEYFQMVESSLNSTQRGSGGFGSTDKK